MKLYIAEKPSLGRAIASALPGAKQQKDGFIKTTDGDCVSWCVGHLLEQAEPHQYNAEYKSWRMQHLPIIPGEWKLQPKSQTKAQLAVLRKLVKEADEIVHAGDPDREGQLLVDQVIDYLKVSARRRGKIQRLLINDMNPEAVKRALEQVELNKNYAPLSVSALARSRADWVYGINMTRAYTIQGRKVGYDGVLSVGRVQTPVLGLVVRRCDEIENFVSKPFYEVKAHLVTEKKESFTANWRPSEACEPYMDEARRVLVKKLAENVVERIADQPAVVKSYTKKDKKQAQPLPYSLSILQIDAARRFGLDAQSVLTACQALYERHKLVTYPRSDCRYLPKAHYKEASNVLAAVRNNLSDFHDLVDAADTSTKSPAWNDGKVTAHHAIIPTQKKVDVKTLSNTEKNVYELIARQYVAQFYPVHKYADTRVEVEIAGGLFVASAKTILDPGWQVLFQRESSRASKKGTGAKGTDGKSGDIAEEATLPILKKGQKLHCNRGELLEKKTTPPPYFTDATLLAAMTGIARFVSSQEIRKILKDTDGLGTEATRAGIIELLFRRGFLTRKGKQIHATDAGRGLIRALPEQATLPDMTAHWEFKLNAISQKEASYQDFMEPLTNELHALITQSQSGSVNSMKGVANVSANRAPDKRGKSSFKKKLSKKKAKKKAARRTSSVKKVSANKVSRKKRG